MHAFLPQNLKQPHSQQLTLSLGQLPLTSFIEELSSCHPAVQVPHGSAALVHSCLKGSPALVCFRILWDGDSLSVSYQARRYRLYLFPKPASLTSCLILFVRPVSVPPTISFQLSARTNRDPLSHSPLLTASGLFTPCTFHQTNCSSCPEEVRARSLPMGT